MTVGLAAATASAIADAHTKGTSYTGNSNYWVKLHTADPGAAGATAPAGNTTRQQVTFGTSSSGAIANSAAITWTSVSTTETYTHFSAWTASTAGTFLGSGTVTGGAVTAGNNFSIPIGDFDITFGPIAA
jgi:hypothetical protein